MTEPTEPRTGIQHQLRALGQAVEEHTTAVAPQQILDAPPSIGIDQPAAPAPAPVRQRRLAPLAAAAALVALAIASFALLTRPDPAAELGTADTAFAQPSQSGPADDNGWEQLRQCESTGDYAIDTGNTFYGAYQFTRASWREAATSIGLRSVANENPATVSPAIQDAIASALHDERGADPWPVCGRFITGPMITPLVPQWMGELPDPNEGVEVIVFLDPDVAAAEQEEIEQYLSDILGLNYERLVTYVDQEASFAEFQQMFADQDEIRESINSDDMPTSYRIGSRMSPMVLDRVRGMSGVFQIVYPPQYFDPVATPRKIIIEALDVQAPLLAQPSAPDLATGAGVLAESERGLVVAGYGSFEGSVFGDLDALDLGDAVGVYTLIDSTDEGPFEVLRTYEVVTAPQTMPITEIEAFTETNKLVGLILVADVPGDAALRTVVELRLATVDRASYGLSDT